VIPAPFYELVMTDNESLNARRLDSGARPGGNKDPLIEVGEKGAGAGMSRTSAPAGYAALLIPRWSTRTAVTTKLDFCTKN